MRLAALCLLLCFVGCVEPEPTVVPVSPPVADIPTCNLPVEMRQKNWLGDENEGSCVWASEINAVLCHNEPELAAKIRRTCGNGATQYDIINFLQSEGRKRHVDFDVTFQPDAGFFDWANRNGYATILWWKTGHCCSFHGWILKPNGREYAVILDNNFPQDYELTERSEFERRWANYGHFALANMRALATVVPYQSYELVYE